MKFYKEKWLKFIAEQKDSNKVAKIVLLQGDKILFLISKGGKFDGQIDLPGGHIHYKEDMSVGLQREIREETGLIVNKFHKLYEKDHTTFFWGVLPGENIKLSDEHSTYELRSLDEIFKKGYIVSDNFLAAIREALKHAIKT